MLFGNWIIVFFSSLKSYLLSQLDDEAGLSCQISLSLFFFVDLKSTAYAAY